MRLARKLARDLHHQANRGARNDPVDLVAQLARVLGPAERKGAGNDPMQDTIAVPHAGRILLSGLIPKEAWRDS